MPPPRRAIIRAAASGAGAAALVALALAACARLSGLDDLVKDDTCAASSCADARADTDPPRIDAGKDADLGDAGADAARDAASDAPVRVTCGATECARGCCIDDAGAATCVPDSGQCGGFLVECDSHEECRRTFGPGIVCCARHDLPGAYIGIECVAATACDQPICANDAPVCDPFVFCTSTRPGAPLACKPE